MSMILWNKAKSNLNDRIMQAQRKGSNLKIEIRLALSVLKRDPYIKLPNSIAALEKMKRELHSEAREAGFLKPGY